MRETLSFFCLMVWEIETGKYLTGEEAGQNGKTVTDGTCEGKVDRWNIRKVEGNMWKRRWRREA